MRRAGQVAALSVFLAGLAYQVGCYVRQDYQGDEPARDIAAGLSVLGVAGTLAWLADGPREGADVER